jgi:CheY-like chemotaxis protein
MVAVAERGASKPTPRSLRILVVEDHVDSRELLAELLRHAGPHQIEFADSGEQGLLCLRSRVYDLLVTDIRLPGISGLEMIDHATREGRLVGTEIVVCSANHWLRPQVVARGGRYIPKPVDIAEILDAVRAVSLPPSGEQGSRALNHGEDKADEGAAARAPHFEHRVSGYDFVRALLLAGYRVVGKNEGHAFLAREEIELSVPQVEALSEQTMLALLETAKIPPVHMRTLLHRLGSRDTWPDILSAASGERGAGER